MKTTRDMAKKFKVVLAQADVNGYWRTTQHFDYELKSGYKGFCKNFSLVLENHMKGTHKLKSINGVAV